MAEPAPLRLRRVPPPVADFDAPGLQLTVERELGMGKVQVLGLDPDARARDLLDMPVPAPNRQADQAGITLAWMAPGEWLVTGPRDGVADLTARAGAAPDALAVDITDGRIAFRVSGADARDALAAHCPLDLADEQFPVDAVARSMLGDTGLFIARLPDLAQQPCFRLVLDQTMATYAARMLSAARPIQEPARA